LKKPPIVWRFFFRKIAVPMMHIEECFGYYVIGSNWIQIARMSTQKVFIFWVTPLFYESICWLLKHPDIKLVGATSNYATVPADLLQKKPNTILIEDTGEQHREMVMEYLDTLPWTIKIILLGLRDKELVIYHHEQRSMVQTEDLLQLILSELR